MPGLGVEGAAAERPSVWTGPPISRQEEVPSPVPTPSLSDSREHAPRLTPSGKVCVPVA